MGRAAALSALCTAEAGAGIGEELAFAIMQAIRKALRQRMIS